MDAREAIKAAKSYVEYALEGEDVAQIRLEEIEFDDQAGAWVVTLGLLRPNMESKSEMVSNLLGNKSYKRSYKILTINDSDATVKSMKIRQIESA